MKPSSEFIANRILRGATPGGIILLHDGIRNTREALPKIVNTLRNQGYKFVTLSELFGLEEIGESPQELDIVNIFPPVF